MSRLIRACCLLAAVAAAPAARAAQVIANNYAPADLGVSAAALNTSPAFTVRADGFNALTVYAQYTHGAATAVTMACSGGPTTALQFPVAVANVSATAGTIANTAATFSYAVTGNAALRWVVAPLNDVFVTCTFTGPGASAGDLLSAYARLGGVP